MNRKRVYCFIATFLASVVFCSTFITTFAEANELTSSIEFWQPPENFVDPVTLKIKEFKSLGLNDEQITAELDKLGMGWYPKTGATWMGRMLSFEEVAEMPSRTCTVVPSGEKVDTYDYAGTRQIGRTSCMRTTAASWTGVSSEIVSGAMSVAAGETRYHYLCMQLGNLNSATNWVETVLTHNLGETYEWHTYDSDEGGWAYYMDKNTATTAADTYVIMLDGTQDNDGWNYDVWINYNWVRSGHLSDLWVQAGFQKEVYSDSGTFTDDASNSVFYRNWLHNAQGWSYWTNSVNTWWSTADPVQETHSMGALSYRWETWVEN